MRFYTHRTGDTREVTRFAWLPIKVQNTIYWLEKVTIHQSFNTKNHGKWYNEYIITKK